MGLSYLTQYPYGPILPDTVPLWAYPTWHSTPMGLSYLTQYPYGPILLTPKGLSYLTQYPYGPILPDTVPLWAYPTDPYEPILPDTTWAEVTWDSWESYNLCLNKWMSPAEKKNIGYEAWGSEKNVSIEENRFSSLQSDIRFWTSLWWKLGYITTESTQMPRGKGYPDCIN